MHLDNYQFKQENFYVKRGNGYLLKPLFYPIIASIFLTFSYPIYPKRKDVFFMLYSISQTIANKFYYENFILFLTFLTSLWASLLLGYSLMRYSPAFLKSKVREYTPAQHQKKNNTPTMGGLFIIAATLIGCLFGWYMLYSPSIILLMSLLCFGLIGGIDDWNKLIVHKGISARTKFILQWTTAFIFALALVFWIKIPTTIVIPLVKWQFNIGIFYIAWAMFVIVAVCNAVNLTDGLDGLATITLLPNLILLALLTFHTKDFYSAIQSMSSTIAAIAVIGSLVGFLWYNRYPAKIFMGDVGSLSLGAFYALLALITKQELLIPLAGGMFVIENISVMLQIFWYKKYKKRLFKMAPLHHHFELSGWSETKTTLVFGFCSLALSIITGLIVFM